MIDKKRRAFRLALWVLGVCVGTGALAATDQEAVPTVSEDSIRTAAPSPIIGAIGDDQPTQVKLRRDLPNGSTSIQAAPKSERQPSPPASRQTDVPTSAGKQKPRADPFSTAESMRRLAAGQNQLPVGPTEIPAIRLKGLAGDGIHPSLALVEFEGAGVLVVRAGDVVSLAAKGHLLVVEVLEITSQGIRVRLNNMRQDMFIR